MSQLIGTHLRGLPQAGPTVPGLDHYHLFGVITFSPTCSKLALGVLIELQNEFQPELPTTSHTLPANLSICSIPLPDSSDML